MSRRPKYKSKCVFWDSINQVVLSLEDVNRWRVNEKLKLPEHVWRFDSQHEFKVYLELVRIFGTRRVDRQVRVGVMHCGACYPNGKYWRVDFAIENEHVPGFYDHYVEAKGVFLPEFANILANLEQINPLTFSRTWIVFAQQIPTKNKVVKALLDSEHKSHLLTLKKLEQLTQLS